MKNAVVGALFVLSVVLSPMTSWACESCTVSRLGKGEPIVNSETNDQRWTFEYLFERKDWDVMDAEVLHELHHDGHHVHDRTTEDLHHFRFGAKVTDAFHLLADIPYITRRYLEVDNHMLLGSKQKSEGLGDLSLFGDYQVWQNNQHAVRGVLGIKCPTGSTREKNSIGTRIEASLQPGSGSVDYLFGGIYQFTEGRHGVTANMTYYLKNEGAQDFEFGDVLTTALYYDFLLNPASETLKTYAGLDVIYQNEWKEKEAGVSIADSGGVTLLAGPSLRVQATERVNLHASVSFPAYQNLGGVHQELDYEWTLGGQYAF